MNAAQADLRFPIVAFTADDGVWRMDSLDVLTRCGPMTLKDGMQDGMEIVDSDLRRFVVRSIRKLGRDRPFVPWLLRSLLSLPGYRIEHDLEALPAASLEAVIERTCRAIEAHPDFWCAGDEEESYIPQLVAEVRTARSVGDIFNILGPDDFRAY